MSFPIESHDGRRRFAVEPVAVGGAIVMAVALWLPWHQSGNRSRNAYDLLNGVDRLDLGPGVFGTAWRWLLPFVPALAALAWTAMVLGRGKLLFAAAGAVAFLVGLPAVLGLGTADGFREAGELIALVGLVGLATGLIRSRFSRPRRSFDP